MGILNILKGKKEIELMKDMLIESGRTYVYFDNCFYLDEQGQKVEVLKLEIFPFVEHVEFTISINGVDEVINNRSVTLMTITAAYLNLQKIAREFKNND